jgi:tripartite-type tricarboxylate transporter receptor subunit TctC
MKTVFKRTGITFGAVALAWMLVLGASETRAQPYPAKPVRILVPLSAGGLVDILARNIAPELTRVWGQQVVVENRPGANTIIAAELVAKSPADGYTLLMTNPTTVSMNQFLYKKLPYDPERDFTLVYNVGYAPTVIAFGPTAAANTLEDMVALAKSKPNELTYGSFGVGSTAHIDIELFSSHAGIRLNHIPYKGVAGVLPALASGEIYMGFVGIRPALPLIQQGRIRVIAINAQRRSPLLPNVPTIAEAGYPGLNLGGWFGLLAPSATPRPIIDKIAGDLAQIFAREDVREKVVAGSGLEPLLQNPEQFAAFVRDERVRYSKLIKSLNLSLD